MVYLMVTMLRHQIHLIFMASENTVTKVIHEAFLQGVPTLKTTEINL